MEEPLRMSGKLLFPVEVFKELVRENGESDLFFSPCGLAAALTMLLGGAQGETASQVCLPKGKFEVVPLFQQRFQVTAKLSHVPLCCSGKVFYWYKGFDLSYLGEGKLINKYFLDSLIRMI